ncbi:MAG: SpoIIE family protein phosphatase [candidate division Zixibacteria bacterium]|nr:SpoIIE family protein phosphatase [candidate division Zixibacteria bacterium]
MLRKPIREIVAVFPALESQLAALRKTVEEICLQANLSSKEINNIILAIEEGATNIIRHAYMFNDGEIRLKVEMFKHTIMFSLFDTGKSFQPPDKSKLDLKKMASTGRKGGLGFYLINKVMDRVEYYSLEGENELRMIKFLSDRGAKELEWGGGVSLRVKFSAFTFLIILFLVAGAYYYINSRSYRYIHSQLDKTVDALCNTIASQAYGYIINSRSDVEFDELVVSYELANDILTAIVILDENGMILADSRGPGKLHMRYDENQLRHINGINHKQVFYPEDENPFIVRKIDFGGTELGSVVMEFSPLIMEAELKQARQIILFITVIGLLVGITGIYLLSNYFVRPIGRIVHRVHKFSEGDLDSQLSLTGAGEFYEISKALNELIMRMRRDRKNIVEREILHKEMQMAEEIQKSLIPSKLPQVKGFNIGTIYKAARMVGGDLFDIIAIDEDTFGIVVADVSGKGVPGSLVMSMVRTVIRLEARDNHSAKDVIVKVNDFVADDIRPGMFVTMLLAIINTRENCINFVSAGHNPIIHFDSKSKEAKSINVPGMPVGLQTGHDEFANAMESGKINMNEDDFLLMYTDGVTEERGINKSSYGTERLVELLKENGEKSGAEMATIIENDIAKFVGQNEQHDDITMVILKSCPKTDSTAENIQTESTKPVKDKPQIDSVTVKNNKRTT